MSNSFFEIKNVDFYASEKNKVKNVDLKIDKQGEIIKTNSSIVYRIETTVLFIMWILI